MFTQHPLRFLLLVVFVAPSALLCTAIIVSAMLRTLRLPACPNCLCNSARPSRRVGLIEHAATAICLFPFRCGHCLKRFYAFDRARWDHAHIHLRSRAHTHHRSHAHTHAK
jgi:hypothetical protein